LRIGHRPEDSHRKLGTWVVTFGQKLSVPERRAHLSRLSTRAILRPLMTIVSRLRLSFALFVGTACSTAACGGNVQLDPPSTAAAGSAAAGHAGDDATAGSADSATQDANADACPDGRCACRGLWCEKTCCRAEEVCYHGACCAPSCAGKECGSDGCGQSCGECEGCGKTDPQFCMQNGICAQPCCPRTCLQIGAQCGIVSDGCGSAMDCGHCEAGACFQSQCR
jgi:hypothetical protein